MHINSFFHAYFYAAQQILTDVPEAATAAGVAVLCLIAFYCIKHLVLPIIGRIVVRSEESWLSGTVRALTRVSGLFYVPVALLIGVLQLKLPVQVTFVLHTVLTTTLVVQLTLTLQNIMRDLITRAWEGRRDATAAGALKVATTLVLWIAALLLILNSLDIKVTTFVASLGVAGIAVAFAIQNILADIFSSFSIYFDRPFRIGDKIEIGSDAGIVRKIGLKTTRIETARGEELVIPNKELTGTRIRNFRRMRRRQCVTEVVVATDTALKTLKKIPHLISEVLKDFKNTDCEHVLLREFHGGGFVFELVYFIDGGDGATHAKTQHLVNFAILEVLDAEGVRLAAPMQLVQLKKS